MRRTRSRLAVAVGRPEKARRAREAAEELLPVLQVGWVHFEEGRATGVPRLQHVRRLELGTESSGRCWRP